MAAAMGGAAAAQVLFLWQKLPPANDTHPRKEEIRERVKKSLKFKSG